MITDENFNLKKIRKVGVNAFDQSHFLEKKALLAWAMDEQGKWTQEFKKWFSDSVLIDKNGTPLIYYHGMNWTPFLHTH
jgi:hypothetical protein